MTSQAAPHGAGGAWEGSLMPVAGPWITDLEVEYVSRAAATAWYSHAGDFQQEFESLFAVATTREFAISLPSCTAAIHLALAALGIGPGDEVIVPDATWIATAAPISYVGATPVFADIDRDTWCLRPDSVEECITPRTRAILAVDLYGGMPDMQGLQQVADRHALPLIEDAAEAIGSRYHDRPAGAFGTASVFSFHGSKTLTTGEGGMVVTDDSALHHRMLKLRDHGREPGNTDFINDEIGFKYKMTAMQAALGTAQLKRLDDLIGRKRQVFAAYAELGRLPGISLNVEPEGTVNSYWMVTAVADPATGLTTDIMRHTLSHAGIDSRPFFHPLSSLPAYAGTASAGAGRERNVVAYSVAPRAVNLPSALLLSDDDVHRVADVVRDMFAVRR